VNPTNAIIDIIYQQIKNLNDTAKETSEKSDIIS